ncbi:MAG: aspartate kinase, partial [Lachnospiraceae bacterium]|nr:aspartate kinase [Lachnospiraceae bacterium]
MAKVVKFGGSSLASAEQFKKVGDIIKADPERRYVVPSAPGKRSPRDTKVTDMLYNLYDSVSDDRSFSEVLKNIRARYDEIIKGLGIKLDLSDEFKLIEKNLKGGADKDYAASRGEYLNGRIMAAYLGYEFLDPADYIIFDKKTDNYEAEKTYKKLGTKLSKVERAVIPGFYGAYADGTVKTFSRGGSDITGSIVARAIHADVYENWTDVSGFMIA